MGGADNLGERHNLSGEWIPRQLPYYECGCRIPGALTGSRCVSVALFPPAGSLLWFIYEASLCELTQDLLIMFQYLHYLSPVR
jgi:hypothetical protein